MGGSNFMHVWVALLGSLAMIVLILTAFGLMLGIVKPANAPKHIGTILGLAITAMLLPGVLVSAWSGMSLWQQIALVAIGIALWQWWRPRPQPRIRRRD